MTDDCGGSRRRRTVVLALGGARAVSHLISFLILNISICWRSSSSWSWSLSAMLAEVRPSTRFKDARTAREGAAVQI